MAESLEQLVAGSKHSASPMAALGGDISRWAPPVVIDALQRAFR